MNDVEPFCITNPSRKCYKFLFRVRLDEDTLFVAQTFITDWLAKNNWTVRKQKTVPLPREGMFQIRVWRD